MSINYNSLGNGRDTWLKNDVGDGTGSPPGKSSIKTMAAWLLGLVLLCLLTGQSAFAQVAYSQDWTATGLNSWTSASSGGTWSRNATASQICGTTGGTIRVEEYYGTNGQFTSPSLGTSNGGLITMSYNYKITNYSAGTTATPAANIGVITLEYASSTSGPWTVAQTINSTNHTATNTCTSKTATFTPSPGALYVRFNITSNTGYDVYYYFDDVAVSQGAAPTCLVPTGVTASATSATSANLSWTASTSAPSGGYDWEVRSSGAGGSGATGLAVSGTTGAGVVTATASTLTANTAYTLYVRSRCSGGTDLSTWTASSTFTTPCTAITSLPWTENFDSMSSIGASIFPSTCWKTTGGTAFATQNAASQTYNDPRSTPYYVTVYYPTTASYLWTPAVQLTAGISYDFSFYWAGDATSGWLGDVNVNTSQSGTGATALGSSFVVAATTTTNAYTKVTRSFTPTSTGVYYFAVKATATTSAPYYMGFDDFRIETTPNCVEPTALSGVATNSSTANLSWTASASSPTGGYQWEVRSSGAGGSGATGLAANGTTPAGTTAATATGLSASTTYTLYVRSDCGAGLYSTWASSTTFTTPCANITSFPFLETFDATSTTLGCWGVSAGTGASYQWAVTTADATYGVAGPAASTRFAFLNVFNASTTYNTYNLITPKFTLPASGKQLRYKYFLGSGGYKGTTGATGTDPYPLTVQISVNGAAFTTLYGHSSSNSTIATSNATTNWTSNTIDLSAYANSVIQIKFVSNSNYGSGTCDQALDEVYVEDVPACTVPSALSATSITANGASIGFTSTGTSFIVEYGATGFTPGTGATAGTGGTIVTGTASPIALTGLTANTSYQVYVRQVCAGPTYSPNSSAISFTTPCIAVASLNENFDGVTAPALPSCWTSILRGATVSSFATVTTTSTNHTSPNAVQIYSSSSASTDDLILVSPNLSNLNVGNYQVRFWAYGSSGENVQVGTLNGNGSTATFTALQTVTLSTTWTEYTVSFASYSGTNNYIGFRKTNASTYNYIYIDDVVWEPIPTCFKPTGVTISGVTNAAATISWTAPASGTPASYQYEVRTSGAAGSGATGLATNGSVTAPTVSISVSSLTPDTAYSVYVRTFCGGTDYSAWTTVTTFRTQCNPIVSLPWTENFDAMTTIGNGILPSCWSTSGGLNSSYLFTTQNAASQTYNDPKSTPNYVTIYYPTTAAYLWTPGFQLAAGSSYEFTFYWAGDGTSGWVGDGLVNTSASATGATSLGSSFVVQGTTTTSTYTKQTYTFVPSSSGTYFFAIKSFSATSSPFYMGFDDFSVKLSPPVITSFTPASICTGGTDAQRTVVITGNNLSTATSVSFGGVAAQSFTVNGATQITAVVSPSSPATSIISITGANGTGTSATPLTVYTSPTVAAIQNGNASLCTPSTRQLTETTFGGNWSSSNTNVATVDNNGLVTSVAAGSTVISYAVSDNGCTTTVTTTINVNNQINVTSSPVSQTVVTGSPASYSIAATGSIVSYQWQYSTDGGDTFSDVVNDATYSGATTNTLSLANTPASLNGYYYQVVVTMASPCPAYTSSPVILNVGDTGIATDPSSVALCNGGTAVFTVVASGTVDSYAWEEDQAFGFAPITDGTFDGVTYSGSTTNQLTVSGLGLSNTGWAYHAVVTGPANGATSNAATLTVNEGVNVTVNPADQLACSTGATKSFSVTATGNVTGYQWQVSSTLNGTYADIANGTAAGLTYSGVTTATLSVTNASSVPVGNYFYRAVVKAAAPCTNQNSTGGKLSITAPVVSVTPSSATFCSPGSGVSLTANGATSYSWSPATGLSATTGATVIATPSATTTYTVTGTDANGCTATKTVVVTVSPIVSASASADKSVVCPGSAVVLTANGASAFTTGAIGGYTFANTTSPYASIVGGSGTVALSAISSSATATTDDGITVAQTLPFTFSYGGNAFTSFKLNSNGWINLGGAATSYTEYSALTTTNNTIAVFNRDLDSNNGTGASYYVQTVGTAPNRIVKIEWTNLKSYSTVVNPDSGNAQIWLYETTNVVELHYGAFTTSSGRTTSGTVQVGLRGASSGVADVRSLSNTGSWSSPTLGTANASTVALGTFATPLLPDSGRTYRFLPSSSPVYSYSWATAAAPGTVLSTSNPYTANPSVNTSYVVTVSSATGCSATASVPVTIDSGATISTQPVGATTATTTVVCQGTPVSFTVAATGPGVTYQWRKGGVNITGNASATTATLTIASSLPADSGSYDVVATPSCGAAATSNAIAVTVNPTPTAVAPSSQTYCAGTATSAIALTGTPSGVTYAISGGTAIGLANASGLTAIPSFTPVAGTATITITPSANGCTGTAIAYSILVNALPSAVTVTPNAVTICANGNPVLLTANGGVDNNAVALSENFNASAPAWTITNGSSSPTVSNWSYPSAPYTDPSGSATFLNFTTTNGGKFALANADAGGSGSVTNTVLTSPTFSLAGYTSANLTFEHAYQYWASGDTTVKLEISTDGGTTWSQLVDYKGTNVGTTTSNGQATAPASVSLTSYLGQANLKIRYNYVSTWGYYWIIDNVKVSGSAQAAIAWTPVTGLYTNAAGTTPYVLNASASTVYARPTSTQTYTATPTSAAGCASTAGTSTVTVNPVPTATAPATQTVCSGVLTSPIAIVGTPAGVTFDISGGSSIGLSDQTGVSQIPAFTATGTSAVISITPKANGCTGTAVTFTINVSPVTVGGSVTGSATAACSGSNSGLLTLSGNTGTVVRWESSVSPFTVWTPIANTASTYTSGALTQTTQFRAVVKSGSCSEAASSAYTVTINSVTLTSISSPQVCLNADATITMNGLVPNSTSTVTFSRAGVTQPTVVVTADALGTGSFNIFVTGSSQVITVLSIQRTDATPSCTFTPSSGNSITLVTSAGCTQLMVCGYSLTAIDATLYANVVTAAQAYRWRVTTLTGPNASPTPQFLDTSLRTMKLTQLAQYAFDTQYKIEVSTMRSNVWGPYGAACNASTPATTTSLISCPQQVLTTMSDIVYANLVPYVTGYRFKITDPLNAANTQTFDRATRDIRMNLITAFPVQYNKVYDVQLALRNTDGTYLPFGSACTVKTPVFPTTSLIDAQCEDFAVATNSTPIYANSYSGAIAYAFQLTGPTLAGGPAYPTGVEVVKTTRVFSLSDFTGLIPGATYVVKVRLIFNGTDPAGPYGKSCSVVVPGASKAVAVETPFNAVAYPNPFADNFNIDVTTSAEDNVTVKVYDMTGRLLEAHNVHVAEMETLKVGDRYPSGVYNVIVSQGDKVKTLRVVKR